MLVFALLFLGKNPKFSNISKGIWELNAPDRNMFSMLFLSKNNAIAEENAALTFKIFSMSSAHKYSLSVT